MNIIYLYKPQNIFLQVFPNNAETTPKIKGKLEPIFRNIFPNKIQHLMSRLRLKPKRFSQTYLNFFLELQATSFKIKYMLTIFKKNST